MLSTRQGGAGPLGSTTSLDPTGWAPELGPPMAITQLSGFPSVAPGTRVPALQIMNIERLVRDEQDHHILLRRRAVLHHHALRKPKE